MMSERSSKSVLYWYQRLSAAPVEDSSPGGGEGARAFAYRLPDDTVRLLAGRIEGDRRKAAILVASCLHALYQRFGWDQGILEIHPGLHSPEDPSASPIFLRPADLRGNDLRSLSQSAAKAWEEGLPHRHYDLAVLAQWLAANNLPAIDLIAPIRLAPSDQSQAAAASIEVDGGPAAKLQLTLREAHGSAQRVALIATHFPRLLHEALGEPGRAFRSIPLVSAEEIASRGGYGCAAAEPRARSSLDEAFASAALRHGESIAVVAQDGVVTYAELDRASNAIARNLRDRFGVRPGDGVALKLEKRLHLVTAIIGALKAGAAYVPVEVTSPRKRAEKMLKDSGAKVLLSHAALLSGEDSIAPAAGVPVAAVEEIASGDAQPLPFVRTRESVAYIMYTSGSTGEPKGVMVQDGPVVELACSSEAVPVAPGDRVLQALPYTFDPSVADIFSALLNGGTICLISAETLVDIDALAAFVQEHEITIGNLNTALVNTITEARPDLLGAFTWLCSGGERTFPSQVGRALAHLQPGATLAHVYGPTEATVIATIQNLGREHESGSIVPIGRPLRGTTIRVLDAQGMDAPAGVEGELYIGGNRLALGYTGDASLTEARFIHMEVPGQGRERFYRTGDMVRFNESGVLEFIGRTDKQLKIRGRRVDIGEVESAVSQVPRVAAVHVEPQKYPDGSSLLVAYYEAHDPVTDEEMRRSLTDFLPEHMMPAAFVHLQRLPLNLTGKVDAGALPDWREGLLAAEDQPSTYMERRLGEIWQEELGLETLGRTQDFFSVGGDSLKAIPIIKRIADETGLELTIRDLFDNACIADLANLIETSLVGGLQPGGGVGDALNGAAADGKPSNAGTSEPEGFETHGGPGFSPHSGRIEANGVNLHLLDWGGEGETLLCLPGLSHTAHIFEGLAKHFTDRFRVIALTRRGHGGSDQPPSGYDTETLVADLAAFFDRLGIAKAHIVGHSMAGQEMTRFSELYPGRVLSLIYLDAAYDRSRMLELEDWSPIRVADADALRSWGSLREWYQKQFGFWSQALQHDLMARYIDDNGLRPVMSRVTGTSLLEGAIRTRPNFDRVRAPALLLYAAPEEERPASTGTSTATYASWCAAQIADVPTQFSNAHLVKMAGAHHFLYLEREAEVVHEMTGFLAALAGE